MPHPVDFPPRHHTHTHTMSYHHNRTWSTPFIPGREHLTMLLAGRQVKAAESAGSIFESVYLHKQGRSCRQW